VSIFGGVYQTERYMNVNLAFRSCSMDYLSDVSGEDHLIKVRKGFKMSAMSLKSFVVTAAIGFAAVFTAGASANAASPASVPAVSTAAHSPVINIDYRGNRHHGRPAYRGPACSVEGAKMKAHRMGIRNARVVYRGKSVQVRGFRHGRPTGVVFANVRGCPIIR